MLAAVKTPVLLYDGECHFCGMWIARWREATGAAVSYRTAQEAGAEYPEIGAEEFATAVQWVGPNGERARGAEAALRALATSTRSGRILLWAYSNMPGFRAAAEGFYGLVAANRTLFSRATRLLWGQSVLRPTYAISSRIFLHLLGLIFLLAFWSYGRQLDGLVGSQGILPAARFFSAVRDHYGSAAFWQVPSVFLWGASDAALHGWCVAGLIAAALLMLGLLPGPSLLILWVAYLSLDVAGQLFFGFQWDALLLETAVLALLLTPWTWRLRWTRPPAVAHLLMLWLLFRLMFASGVVKLTSGDPTWHNATALDFHYFTQPLPTVLAWFAQQAPGWWQALSVKMMFVVELGFPWLIFLPRRLRLLGAAGLAGLQVLIGLTGSYGFFNLLTVGLCLLLIDDAVWRRWLPITVRPRRGYLPRPVVAIAGGAFFLLSLLPLSLAFRQPLPWPAFAITAYEKIAPFRSMNQYGLFAVMTTQRQEIVVQGSEDGHDWKTYVFRYKPGPLTRAPRWAGFSMPRLDWRMWFAALDPSERTQWFAFFLLRLQEGSPAVTALLEQDPFARSRPRYVRALLDDYRFTTPTEKWATGDWWRTEPAGIYFPEDALPPRFPQ